MAENQNLREARSYQFAAEFELRRAQERLAGLTSLGRLERETDTLRRETQQLQDAQREYQQLQNQPGAPQVDLDCATDCAARSSLSGITIGSSLSCRALKQRLKCYNAT
jgi:hypothetical protein